MKQSGEGSEILHAFSPVLMQDLPGDFHIATSAEMKLAVTKAASAFEVYKQKTPVEKAVFLETIAAEIQAINETLINRAMLETALPEARLTGEIGRTCGQLKLFADILREGSWVEAVIDEKMPERKPLPRADIRKMLIPIGPVLVFGASNFPFAFSTAGGDTASALAAGNPVIVKAHEGHLGTNELVGGAIKNAAVKCGMPDGVFSFVINNNIEAIESLVKEEDIKAIGFTGSFKAGTAIYKTATSKRKTPIPVYAEMSSVNPVLILPNKLKNQAGATAALLATSVTMGTGQFCTNPGLIFLIENEETVPFTNSLAGLLSNIPASTMLNKGVCNNYYTSRKNLEQQQGVNVLTPLTDASDAYKGAAMLLSTTAEKFISNEALQSEVFGPSSLIVLCKNEDELNQSLQVLHGQLTGTVLGEGDDYEKFAASVNLLSNKVGRILFNGVPTGVEVGHAMVHGGPFPATTNAASTSVGADAIKRFTRPLCLQDCPSEYLPDALKDGNPLNIMRKMNGQYTR
ncbi:MAG: aldehyde dehydrogenase (NADP(+)) [Bacteroidota bacterium]